jgi:hypothetical protein
MDQGRAEDGGVAVLKVWPVTHLPLEYESTQRRLACTLTQSGKSSGWLLAICQHRRLKEQHMPGRTETVLEERRRLGGKARRVCKHRIFSRSNGLQHA